MLVVLHCSLSDNKSPRVSMTLLRILAYSNIAIVKTVPIFSQISYSSNLSLRLWWSFQANQLQLLSASSSLFNSFFPIGNLVKF